MISLLCLLLFTLAIFLVMQHGLLAGTPIAQSLERQPIDNNPMAQSERLPLISS